MAGERSRRSGARRRRRHPGRSFGRSPVLARTTDRLEDLAAWLLVTLGMLAVVGAALVGGVAHRVASSPGRLDDVTPVRVVLLANAPLAPTAAAPTGSPVPPVPVSWASADGVEHTGELAVRAPATAGSSLTAWLDRGGRLTPSPPQHALEAMAFGIGAALAVGALAWTLLAALWTGVRRAAAVRNDAAWTREWARVEPVWSGQVH